MVKMTTDPECAIAAGTPRSKRRLPHFRGFTLIELLVVMAIVATLLAIAAPRYFTHLERAREAALRETLHVTRDAIDKYLADSDSYPDRLDDLVSKRYLRSLPFDPITDSNDTWVVLPPPAGGVRGQVYDLKSGAEGNGMDGRPYAEY